MFPLSRLLKYGKIIDDSMILDVDFSTATIGSTEVIDNARGSGFSLIRGPVGVVEYDEELDSNVYNCSDSTGYARTGFPVQGTVLDFSQYTAFEIQYKMKCSPSGIQTFFETGNYNSRRVFGFVNSFNQYAATYNQLFVDWGDNFARILPTWTNPNAWDVITMTFTKGVSITVHSELNNATQTFPWYTIRSGEGQYFSLFGSYVDGDNGANPYPFKGKVQYVKIRKL